MHKPKFLVGTLRTRRRKKKKKLSQTRPSRTAKTNMSLFAKFRTQMVSVLKYFNLNTNVGRDVFPKKEYRAGPASAPHPEFSLNFPVKSENLADMRYAERQTRMAAESGVKLETMSTDPRTDPRNAFHHPTLKQIPFAVPDRRTKIVQVHESNA
jgi:hypothetical protein